MHQSEGNNLAATSELKVSFMAVGSELEVSQQSGTVEVSGQSKVSQKPIPVDNQTEDSRMRVRSHVYVSQKFSQELISICARALCQLVCVLLSFSLRLAD